MKDIIVIKMYCASYEIIIVLVIVQLVKLKPFVCSECGKGYSCNYRFQKHLREEHQENTIKQQKRFHYPMCNQETKSFFTLLEMRKHCREEHQNDLGVVHASIQTYVKLEYTQMIR